MLIRVLKLEKYYFMVHLEQIKMCDLVAIIHKLTHDNHLHLHLVILQTLLSKATYNLGNNRTINRN